MDGGLIDKLTAVLNRNLNASNKVARIHDILNAEINREKGDKELVSRIADETLEKMADRTDEERLDLFRRLKEEYCDYCGGKHPSVGRRCQCMNDE